MIPARGKLIGSYVNSALIKSDALLSGYDEALVLSQDGHVAEASAANFFMVRDGVVVTPPITDNARGHHPAHHDASVHPCIACLWWNGASIAPNFT
ncbi:MAG: aminotransferase class IV [Caldilineaceae bacterium]